MLVISAKSGQLGNRLLLFANCIAFAIENKIRVFNPAFAEYAEFFESTSRDLFCAYPPLNLPISINKFARTKCYQFNRRLAESGIFKTVSLTREKPFNWSDSKLTEELQTSAIVFMQGWLLRDGWFVKDTALLQKHSTAIRKYFTPLKKYRLNVIKLISSMRNQADIIVGVHIRHGDYAVHQNGKYFYQIEEYVKVMKSVEKLFSNQKVAFLICTNGEQNPQLLKDLNYYFANNHIIEDLYALAECDYIIGPPSSYTMWASFYGDRPLYKIRDVNQEPNINDFVHFYEWQGIFYYREDWSQSFWEWTN
ncbi:alpha-1,2-fucosyltransferase [Phormidium sp. LEGE 05292]|uniref:alpha-1,2-fucosyltransferase n=1 Tax=[Phormidium] sp. LEGE 05292 TaxID=767427 RepID=UPI001881FB0D|nr:alpha-1,2-fucosyltransferase [Phormidium sp. LEGE 05292]MBE9227737.1 alpha-1,2-fucosyltransferase [Phormidium sp. LEGE 05292]